MNPMRCVMVCTVLTLHAALPAHAQYMYLDANGNGIHDAGDVLNPNGAATTVDIYLVTNVNADSSMASCASDPSVPLAAFGYSINLLAANGAVTFSGFTNQIPAFTVPFGEINPGDGRYKNGFSASHPDSALPVFGAHRLASLTITGSFGTPQVDIVANVAGVPDPTFFGTPCLGADMGGGYILGTDWNDAAGLAPASDPSDSGESASLYASGSGRIVLGGNMLDAPYQLEMVGGRLMVNGYSLPPLPMSGPPALTAEGQEIAAVVTRVTSLRDSLAREGASSSTIAGRVRELSSASPLVEAVTISGGAVHIRFKNGFRFGLPLAVTSASPLPTSGPDRRERAMSELRDLQKLVEMGGVVFVIDRNIQHVVSPVNAKRALAAMADLRRGIASTDARGYTFPPRLQSQLRQPVRLVRER